MAFASRFGELDDVSPYTKLGKKHRLAFEQLFDVSNLLEDGSVASVNSHRAAMNKGNSLFHVDSSFNPRRAGYSLLKAHELPPKGTGGATEYADTRTAFDELPEELKKELLEKDYVACHSLYHSRKTAAPGFLTDINPEDHFMSRHKLVQRTPECSINIVSGLTKNCRPRAKWSYELVHRLPRSPYRGRLAREVEAALRHAL